MNSKNVEGVIRSAMIKSVIAAYAVTAVASLSLADSLGALTFSGKRAYGQIEGIIQSNNVSGTVWVFEDVAKYNQEILPSGLTRGALFFGYDSINGCSGDGVTLEIEFAATKGPVIAKTITASGTIPVYWSAPCNKNDEVSFAMNLSAIGDKATRSWGTTHFTDGNSTHNQHTDDSYISAYLNNSSITSTLFGPEVLMRGYVGDAQYHTVDISSH